LDEIFTIELFGQTHTFKANSEVTKAKAVADLLVKEVCRIEDQQENQSSNMSKITILMLAALNIANENIEMKSDHAKLLHDITDRTTNLIHTLDSSVQ
jgi:cell division protein ZapA (FtsZ GTPase activity inhibitor)